MPIGEVEHRPVLPDEVVLTRLIVMHGAWSEMELTAMSFERQLDTRYCEVDPGNEHTGVGKNSVLTDNTVDAPKTSLEAKFER